MLADMPSSYNLSLKFTFGGGLGNKSFANQIQLTQKAKGHDDDDDY